jgi:hypothetical protein
MAETVVMSIQVLAEMVESALWAATAETAAMPEQADAAERAAPSRSRWAMGALVQQAPSYPLVAMVEQEALAVQLVMVASEETGATAEMAL